MAKPPWQLLNMAQVFLAFPLIERMGDTNPFSSSSEYS
jgi:hypothetical protein